MLKPSIKTEPVVVMSDGNMAVRTTIQCFVESNEDCADVLADVLCNYIGKNIQIVIDIDE